jgi:hypothetical protein
MNMRGWLRDIACGAWRSIWRDFGNVWIGRRCGMRMRDLRFVSGFQSAAVFGCLCWPLLIVSSSERRAQFTNNRIAVRTTGAVCARHAKVSKYKCPMKAIQVAGKCTCHGDHNLVCKLVAEESGNSDEPDRMLSGGLCGILSASGSGGNRD